MRHAPNGSPSLWGLVGIVAWEFLSYPVFASLVMRWIAREYGFPVWTVAVAGFLGFGLGVWRLTVRLKVKK